MRRFSPLTPPKDIDPRIYSVFKRINDYLEHASAGWGSLSRGEIPDGTTTNITNPPGPSGPSDHGKLGGLVSVLSGTTVLDYNDDHTQYALLAGRPAGQYLYGSRASGSGGPWNPVGLCMGDAYANSWPLSQTYTTAVGGVTQDIAAGHAVIMVVSSDFTHGTVAATGGEDTDWHLTMANNGSANTWTKLKEWSHVQGTLTQRTVSIWYSILDNAITSASTQVTVEMTTADGGSGGWYMRGKSMLGYAFNVAASSTITLMNSTGSGQDDAKILDALALDEDGTILYLRGIGAFGFAVQDPDEFLPTAGFTSFAPNGYSAATDYVVPDTSKYTSAKAEFRVSTDGQTSRPTGDSWASAVYDFANIFLALRVIDPTNGLLNLGSINDTYAANTLMQGSVITHNASFINFQDSGGSTTYSYIDGSDGGFHIIANPTATLETTFDMAIGGVLSESAVVQGATLDSANTRGGQFQLSTAQDQATLLLRGIGTGGPILTTFSLQANITSVDFTVLESKPYIFYIDGVERFRISETGAASSQMANTGMDIERLVSNETTSAPGVTDDIDSDYDVGSRWVDTTNWRDWICVDNTAGAAVWVETTGAGAGVTRAYVPAGVTTTIPDRHQIAVSGVYEIDATGLLTIDNGGKLVILEEAA